MYRERQSFTPPPEGAPSLLSSALHTVLSSLTVLGRRVSKQAMAMAATDPNTRPFSKSRVTTALPCKLTAPGVEKFQQFPTTTLLPHHSTPKRPSGETAYSNFSLSASAAPLTPSLSIMLGFRGEYLNLSWSLRHGRIDILKTKTHPKDLILNIYK